MLSSSQSRDLGSSARWPVGVLTPGLCLYSLGMGVKSIPFLARVKEKVIFAVLRGRDIVGWANQISKPDIVSSHADTIGRLAM